MILKYSKPKGVPYIEFEDGSWLSFSTLLEDKRKGFKYLSYSGKVTSEYRLKTKSKKKKGKSFTETDRVTFITDMKFTDIPKDVKSGTLSPVTLNFLKKTFQKLAPDGYFPRENLEILEDMIDNRFNHINLDELEDDPELVDEDVVSK